MGANILDSPAITLADILSSSQQVTHSLHSQSQAVLLPQGSSAVSSVFSPSGQSQIAVSNSLAGPQSAFGLWNFPNHFTVPGKAIISLESDISKPTQKKSALVQTEVYSPPVHPALPFMDAEDLGDYGQPAKPVLKPGFLKNSCFVLSKDQIFINKLLPPPEVDLVKHPEFPASYYIDLYRKASAPGRRGQFLWPADTPNHLGARIPLSHTTFNLEAWRKHLIGYEQPEIVQFLEYGFPLGLQDLPVLAPTLRNHGSAYQFFSLDRQIFLPRVSRGRCKWTMWSSPV